MEKIFAKKDKRSELEKERDRSLEILSRLTPGTDQYRRVMDEVARLNDALMAEKDHERKPISWDTVATCLTQGLSVGMILHHEAFHNVTSKALGFVMKGRVR